MKICLYQGTFNPPHLGHLQAANFVCKACNFDKILFIPAAIPPHKILQENKEAALHRFNMTKLLISGYKNFEISDIEFRRKTPSYTFVTIKELYKEMNLKQKPYFIIGDDAFLKIETWYHSEELKHLVNFIVLPRGNDFDKESFDKISANGYNYTRLNMHKIPISSTEIRTIASNHLPLEGYTTQEVEKYIYEHKLYQNVN